MDRLSCVLVTIRLEDDDLGTDADDEFVEHLENAIQSRLANDADAGYWDGHEFGGGWAAIFCYGKDGALLSDRVMEAVLPFRCAREMTLTNEYTPSADDFVLLLSRRQEEERSH